MASHLLKRVCRAMERIAPLRLAESWDNVGLLLESPVEDLRRKNVLLTNDLTTNVVSEALETNTSVIVSYHPPIFKGLQSLTLANPLQSSLLQCAANGISIYSPHTALDAVSGGVNDWITEGITKGGTNAAITSLVRDKLGPDGAREGGEGRLVTFDLPISMDTLVASVKEHLELSHIQVGYGTPRGTSASLVRTIAICAGSGGSMLSGKKVDVFLTGEMSHHEVLAAVAAGTHVILCGHSNTERGYLSVLASKLRHELERDADQDSGASGMEVLVSQMDQHPLQIV